MNEFRFQIKVEAAAQAATLRFATQIDLQRYHRSLSPFAHTPSTVIREAVEFTRLAAKRWRYYSGRRELCRSAARNPPRPQMRSRLHYSRRYPAQAPRCASQRVKISGESGSNGKRACNSATSFVVLSLLQPKPFASTGRVATAQNSMKFCGVR